MTFADLGAREGRAPCRLYMLKFNDLEDVAVLFKRDAIAESPAETIE